MEEVESELIEIKDTESAKRIYSKIHEYIFNKAIKDKEIVSINRDNMNYTWEEYIFHCINSTVRAHLNQPNHNYYGKPDIHELRLEIFGEEKARESAKKRLEEITGEKFN